MTYIAPRTTPPILLSAVVGILIASGLTIAGLQSNCCYSPSTATVLPMSATDQCEALIAEGIKTARAGNYNRAETLFQSAVDCGDKPDCAKASVANALNRLAKIEIDQWEAPESLEHSKRSFELREKLYGALAPETIESQVTYSEAVYDSPEGAGGALTVLKTAMANAEKGSCPALMKAQIHDDFSLFYFALGQYDESLKSAKEGYKIRLDTVGDRDELAAESLVSIAWTEFYQNKPGPAAKKLEDAVRITEAQLGSNHPKLAIALYDLAQVYDKLDRPDDARKARVKAFAIHSTMLRPDHQLAVDERNSLGLSAKTHSN